MDAVILRFAAKGDALYAFALGWPSDKRLLIKSLPSTAPHYERQIGKVELFGAKSDVGWTRGADGLIRVPHGPSSR